MGAQVEALNSVEGLPEKVAAVVGDLRGRIGELSKELKDAREENKVAREENKRLLERIRALMERNGGAGPSGASPSVAAAAAAAAVAAAAAHQDDAAMTKGVVEAMQAARAAHGRTESAPPESTERVAERESAEHDGATEHVTKDGTPHMLLKGLTTVKQVWEEFHIGSPGRSPLCKLIKEQGMEWRDARYVSKHVFSERMMVVGGVLSLGKVQNISNDDAAQWLQAWQDNKGWHVNRVRKELGILKRQSEKEKKGWGTLILEAVNTSAVISGLVTISGGRTRKDINDERICAEWGT